MIEIRSLPLTLLNVKLKKLLWLLNYQNYHTLLMR